MPNPQPNNLFLSLLITFSIFIPLLLIYVLIKYRSRLKVRFAGVERFLASPAGLTLFTIARIAVGLAGLGVLLATLLPGLMPFGEHAKDLGLGGILYIVLWPLLFLQAIAGFIPYPKRWVAAEPFAAWAILLAVGYMAYSLDMLALNGTYDIGSYTVN